MSGLGRLAITLPSPFHDARACVELAKKAEQEWGYEAIWMAETSGPDSFALAGAGVRYFSSGPNYMPSNPDLGDRIGHTLRELGDRPFWWVSPSGRERVLFWMAGRGYSLFHGMNSGPMAGSGRRTLLELHKAIKNINDHPSQLIFGR